MAGDFSDLSMQGTQDAGFGLSLSLGGSFKILG